MKISDLTNNILVINLDSRKDRLQNCIDQANKYQFEFSRIPAINGNQIENPTKLRNGEYGLILSHLAAIYYAAENNLSEVLVLEDDFQFDEDTNDRLEEIKTVPDDWEIIYLGANHYHLGAGSVPPLEINENVIRVYSSFCTHAMLIKQTMYNIVYQEIISSQVPLDVAYTNIQKRFPCYGFKKNICKQYDNHSDIVNSNMMYNQRGVFD